MLASRNGIQTSESLTRRSATLVLIVRSWSVSRWKLTELAAHKAFNKLMIRYRKSRESVKGLTSCVILLS
jgi:hypothetical protein